jgi:hypothetical protein
MPMVAEVVDAVVGVDTHRDMHEAELAAPNGALLSRLQVPNSSAGFAQLLSWINKRAPGPKVIVAVEVVAVVWITVGWAIWYRSAAWLLVFAGLVGFAVIVATMALVSANRGMARARREGREYHPPVAPGPARDLWELGLRQGTRRAAARSQSSGEGMSSAAGSAPAEPDHLKEPKR